MIASPSNSVLVHSRVLRAFCALLIVGLCAGCAGTNDFLVKQGFTGGPTPVVPPPDPKTQMAALETRIFELVSAERQKIDPAAKTLSIDPELAQVARQKSLDMATKNYFAHAAPDGETTAGLVMNADAKFQGLLGENIAAQHYVAQSGVDVDAFAKRFVQTWIDSPTHKENLAFASYDRTGVGAAVNGDTVYVTQLFASDMGLPPPPDDPPQSGQTNAPDRRQVTRYDDLKSAAAPAAPAPKPPAEGSQGTAP